jgi:serine/threonine-protein kinase
VKSCAQCKARFPGNTPRCPLDGAPLVELPDPFIGKTIGGRYRIESKIGAGGMATVYKASHDLLGRKVAIKFLSPELALDATQRQRFLREARATNRIKHEHIVDISDYGEEENGLVYLVMELLEGEPLANLIARGPIAPREAIDHLLQICRALARAHELEVIHRDLKPENIFLVQRGGGHHVKLLDFGLAHVRNEARLTALGAVFGTPEYMSPEQARGAPVGPASDLYSLGVVFFEMLTGELPFEGSTAELIVKHLKTPPPTVSSRQPSLPPEIDTVVAKMLAKNAAQRHRDAYHLMDDLTALLTLLPGAPRPALFSPPEEAPTAEYRAADADLAALRSDQHATAVPVSVRSWIERRAVFRRALEAAYPPGAAPAWVAQSIDRLEELVDRAVTIESEMQRVARVLAERQEEAAATRERIGRALDELTQDESVLLRQIEDLERRIEQARVRVQQAGAEFQRAWSEAAGALPDGVLRAVEHAVAVETAARRATAWRQAVNEIDEAEATLAARSAARDNLRFQVAQLKGRLGAVNAEVEHELSALRDRASELGALMASTQERLADAGSALAAHLVEFPAARPMIVHGIRGRQTVVPGS